MNLQRLRYLVETADSGTMTAAAKRLHVAQPALSRGLKTLENELGVELFEPDGRGVRLTPKGKEVVDAARVVLEDLDRLVAVARSGSRPLDPLVIATTPTLEPLFDRHFLVAYHLRHPGSAARVRRVSGRDEVAAAVLDGEAMVGFSDLPVSDELEVVPLCEFEIVLLSPPGSDVPELMPVEDLDGRPIILPSPGSKRRAEFDAFFEMFDVEPVVALESDERDCWLEGVLAGIGSVLWYGERAIDAVERGATVTHLSPALRRSIGLSHRRGETRDDVADLVALARDLGLPSWAESPPSTSPRIPVDG